MNDHEHEALMYKRTTLVDGTQRLIEICKCGWVRYEDRAPTSVEWSTWQPQPVRDSRQPRA